MSGKQGTDQFLPLTRTTPIVPLLERLAGVKRFEAVQCAPDPLRIGQPLFIIRINGLDTHVQGPR